MPVEISIRWPITQLWEGREARIFLDDEQDNASSLVDSVSSIPAEMTDLVALFDSGHLVYSIAFLLRLPADLLRCNSAFEKADRGALSLVALTSLVGTAGASLYARQGDVRERVRFGIVGETALGLDEFIQCRLSDLLFEKEGTPSGLRGWKAPAKRIAGLLRTQSVRETRRPRKSGTIFADVLRPVLQRARWTEAQLQQARREVTRIGWNDLVGSSIEVIGETPYERVSACIDSAREKGSRFEASSYTKALAGIAQNVLDLRNQDEHEVTDFLIEAFDSSDHTLFVNPRCTTRFSKRSRAFEELQGRLDGCPYFYLTNIIMVYREFVLEQIARLVDEMALQLRQVGAGTGTNVSRHRSKGILAPLFKLPDHLERTTDRLLLREQLFVNRSLRDVPNVFRYPTEKDMFEQITRLHGFDRRLEGFEKFLKDYDFIASERASLSRETTAELANRFLLTISLLQVLGVAMTAADMKDKLGANSWMIIGALFVAALLPAFYALMLRRQR